MTSEVSCPADVWTDIEKHVFSSRDREVGGILVGRLEDGAAVITHALPALAATSGSANVTFTHEVWEEVHAKIDQDYPDERIVGWYHSHPGFGVFLSEYDRFAHRSFFSDPAMLALVVDPLSGEAGWFAMRDDEPTAIGERRTDRAGLGSAAAAAAALPPTRGRTAAVAVGVGIAAAVAGFFLGASTSTKTVIKAAPQPSASAAPQVTPSPPAVVLPKPAPSAAPSAAPSGQGAFLDYRVQRGDSLWALAAAFFGDPHLWPRLQAANPGHAALLNEGEHLRVPVALPR